MQLFRVLAEFSIQSDLDEQNVQYTIEVCSYQAVIASPLPKDVDFVISTVELPNLGQKNIVIPRMLSESDILHLRRRLLGEVCPE